ncbi:hypothetical protein [Microbacterium marinilacus]|uniref:Lipoprotein n=1 Tax=Microbacterium marinilacus TaxID=415209 RepID=A0ABP7BH82_9MICO|nr:hypothetical protein [Microbacterium marinilacus]MBY0690145.1 hypothetical protein [Microbacterium marinilacus]
MTTARRSRSLAMTAATLVGLGLALTACAPGEDAATPASSSAAADPGASAEPSGEPSQDAGASANSDAVLAEAATDLGDKGVITSVVRSITADGEVMHLRYALTRDGGEPADASFSDLGLGVAPTITDAAALKAYRPFSTSPGCDWNGDVLARQQCDLYVMGTVSNGALGELPAGSTIEMSVLLPSPEGEPETVDVLLGDGLPGFTQIPVEYVDDAR